MPGAAAGSPDEDVPRVEPEIGFCKSAPVVATEQVKDLPAT